MIELNGIKVELYRDSTCVIYAQKYPTETVIEVEYLGKQGSYKKYTHLPIACEDRLVEFLLGDYP